MLPALAPALPLRHTVAATVHIINRGVRGGRMYDVEVVVLDPELAAVQVAEFCVDGRQFATSHLRGGEVVLEFDPATTGTEPTTVGARSLALALEKARKLLS